MLVLCRARAEIKMTEVCRVSVSEAQYDHGCLSIQLRHHLLCSDIAHFSEQSLVCHSYDQSAWSTSVPYLLAHLSHDIFRREATQAISYRNFKYFRVNFVKTEESWLSQHMQSCDLWNVIIDSTNFQCISLSMKSKKRKKRAGAGKRFRGIFS